MQNYRALFSRSFLFIAVLAVPRLTWAYDVPWPPVTPPPGVNSAAFPAPRVEWLYHFLHNIDVTKGKTVDLIFDGDSITDFWQGNGHEVWAERYGTLNAADFGISGDQTQHLLWRLANGQVDSLKPKLVVLMIGTNNMPNVGLTPEQIAEGVKAIVDDYKKRCPGTHILLLGIFPRGEHPEDPLRAKIAATNQILATYTDSKTVTYLDFGAKFLQPDGTMTKDIMPDFLHPSPKGYQIWADAIQPVIDQYCPKSK